MVYKEEDNFNLNKFVSNVQGSWKELQTEKDFADVTLICEDKQILTQKIVLSFSSPVLRYILKQHSNPNPVIYLTSVKFKFLENLVNYMYQGEVTISNGDLSNFLEVAEDLRIRGLYEVIVLCQESSLAISTYSTARRNSRHTTKQFETSLQL